MIRVLLAEDQTIVRCGIVQLLQLTPDIRVVSEASDCYEALRLISADLISEQQQPDVAILDIRMPKLSGIEVLGRWKQLGYALSYHFADHVRR